MFAERVVYHRAIEEVYWRHRIWPKENASPKLPLAEVMSQAQIEKKVEDYLRNSQLLAEYWQRPITPEQLQAEMERMAQNTKQPEVLREIFQALGNDPFVIAECLARPARSERLVANFYAHDQRFHGELKRRAEAELAAHPTVAQMKQTSGVYSETEWVKSESDKGIVGQARRLPKPELAGGATAPQEPDAPNAVKLDSAEWQQNVGKLAAQFDTSRGREAAALGVPAAPELREGGRRFDAAFDGTNESPHTTDVARHYETIPAGKLSPLQEDDAAYYATAVLNKGKGRLKVATIAWLKEPLKSWLAKAEAQVPVTTMAAVSHGYTLPEIPDTCTDDTWTATSTTNAPSGRQQHTAVWTGSEMIVWGGDHSIFVNTGGRYNPSTDSWTATSTTNAPDGRESHTAVWTGSEMIVWGELAPAAL